MYFLSSFSVIIRFEIVFYIAVFILRSHFSFILLRSLALHSMRHRTFAILLCPSHQHIVNSAISFLLSCIWLRNPLLSVVFFTVRFFIYSFSLCLSYYEKISVRFILCFSLMMIGYLDLFRVHQCILIRSEHTKDDGNESNTNEMESHPRYWIFNKCTGTHTHTHTNTAAQSGNCILHWLHHRDDACTTSRSYWCFCARAIDIKRSNNSWTSKRTRWADQIHKSTN